MEGEPRGLNTGEIRGSESLVFKGLGRKWHTMDAGVSEGQRGLGKKE